MDNIFNKKPWIEPLAVAGTSVEEIESDSSEETRTQSSNYIYYINLQSIIDLYLLFIYNIIVLNTLHLRFFFFF